MRYKRLLAIALTSFLFIVISSNYYSFTASVSSPKSVPQESIAAEEVAQFRLPDIRLPGGGSVEDVLRGAVADQIVKALGNLIEDEAPIAFRSQDVYPTVNELPGTPFSSTKTLPDSKQNSSEVAQIPRARQRSGSSGSGAINPSTPVSQGRVPFNPTGNIAQVVAQLQSSADGSVLLQPGDYSIPMTLLCMRQRAASPAGHRYLLAPLKGSKAGVLAALNARAAGKAIPYQSLQVLSWNIQAGMNYEEMPAASQTLVEQLIPDYRQKLSRSFLEQVEATYNQFSGVAGLPSLESALDRLGDVGKVIREYRQFRNTLLQYQNDYQALLRELIPPGSSSSIGGASYTPWSVLGDRVYGRMITTASAGGTGEMQIRVLPDSNGSGSPVKVGVTNIVADSQTNSVQPLTGAPQPAEEEKCEEAIAGNPEQIGIDRWWATAKTEPISVSWTVEIPTEGEYSLDIDIEGINSWDLMDSSYVQINSTKSESIDSNGSARLGCLKPGIHRLKIDKFEVPEEATVEQIIFQLSGASSIPDLVTFFVADHPEVSGIDVNKYAPILYFDKGSLQDTRQEQYAGLYDAASSWSQASLSANSSIVKGDSTHHLTLKESNSGTAYAAVVRNDAGEIAINYYFHYPNSNWRDYGGYNNHLGDWEGITLFLDTLGVPNRVAYSQHVSISNLGTTSDQSDGGIVVPWNYVDREGDRIKVYVGLGGHASYPFPGVTMWFTGLELHKGDFEVVPCNVRSLDRAGSLSLEHKDAWLLYPGRWGANDDSPRGPLFLDTSKDALTTNSGLGLRWLDPWGWSSRFETSALKLGDDRDNMLLQGSYNDMLIGGRGNDSLMGDITTTPYLLKGGLGDDDYTVKHYEDSTRGGGIFIHDEGGIDKLTFLPALRTVREINLALNSPQKERVGLARIGNSLIIDLNQDGQAELVDNNYSKVHDLALVDFFSNTQGGRGKGFIETVGNLTGEQILKYIGGI